MEYWIDGRVEEWNNGRMIKYSYRLRVADLSSHIKIQHLKLKIVLSV
jgi:hypothetical protein